jgi:hypothetical protein
MIRLLTIILHPICDERNSREVGVLALLYSLVVARPFGTIVNSIQSEKENVLRAAFGLQS